MKKFIKLFAIMLCVLISGAALVGCGTAEQPAGEQTAQLTNADVVGYYYTEKLVYTPQNGNATTYTFADNFQPLHNRIVTNRKRAVGEGEPTDDQLYAILEDYFLSIQVREKQGEEEHNPVAGRPYYVNMAYQPQGTWSITNNTLDVRASNMDEDETYEAVYQNGKIVVTVTDTGANGWTAVMTYAKDATLTEADFVGTWHTESYIHLVDGEVDGEPDTFARLVELHNKGDNMTAAEADEYANLETNIYKVTIAANAAPQYKFYYRDDTEYDEFATSWSIENNIFNMTVGGVYAGDKVVFYENGKIIVVASREFNGQHETHICTLAKEVA